MLKTEQNKNKTQLSHSFSENGQQLDFWGGKLAIYCVFMFVGTQIKQSHGVKPIFLLVCHLAQDNRL